MGQERRFNEAKLNNYQMILDYVRAQRKLEKAKLNASRFEEIKVEDD